MAMYDPNMCSVARYSPYPSNSNTNRLQEIENSSLSYSILVPNPISNNHNEQITMDSNRQYILTSESRSYESDGHVVYNLGKMEQITIGQHNRSSVDTSMMEPKALDGNYHFVQDSGTSYEFHHDRPINGNEYHLNDHQNTELILQDSSGQWYRQIRNVYINNHVASNAVELVPATVTDHLVDEDEQVEYICDEANSMIVISNSNNNIHNDHVELLAQESINNTECDNLIRSASHNSFTYDTTTSPTHLNQSEVHKSSSTIEEKKQQRLMIESAILPLLAAVNDITARDEELQYYFSQKNQKKDTNFSNKSCNVSPKYDKSDVETLQSYRNLGLASDILTCDDEYVDINDMDFVGKTNDPCHGPTNKLRSDESFLVRRSQRKSKPDEELMVLDRQVPSRSWASIPNSYLYIAKCVNEPNIGWTVFAKKNIPLRTKFGPFEGDVKNIHIRDISTYKEKRAAANKLSLLVNGQTILDTSNEYTSNWMQYVRLACKFIEQNILLFELGNKLYFKSCQFIGPKKELRVGYSKEYAEKYGLKILAPDDEEEKILYENKYPYACYELLCSKKFATSSALQGHLNEHDVKCSSKNKLVRSKRRRGIRTKLTNRKTTGPTVRYACRYCSKIFCKFISYKRHTDLVHYTSSKPNRPETRCSANVYQHNTSMDSKNPVKCSVCRKMLANGERLEKHMLVHNLPAELKPIQCEECSRRFLTPSALALHFKIHIYKKFVLECPFCMKRFTDPKKLRNHTQIHRENGVYNCKSCDQKFQEYASARKHIRTCHTSKRHMCNECTKEFKTLYKLKEHRRRHFDLCDFLCYDCGEKFKRKNKLRVHVLTVHSSKKNNKTKQQFKLEENKSDLKKIPAKVISVNINEAQESKSSKLFNKKPQWVKRNLNKEVEAVPLSANLSETYYNKSTYKCHECRLGFKRRGMLVNHLAKRHPAVRFESVHELNLPIIKSQRNYFCQYCDKVYKSSSKRKFHIMKYHPGKDLPLSTKHKNNVQTPGVIDPTYTEKIGSVSSDPHLCTWCHKQYALRARLLQHQRNSHRNELQLLDTMRVVSDINNVSYQPSNDQQNTPILFRKERENRLLELSTAASESLRDDFNFFDEQATTPSLQDDNFNSNNSSTVNVNFKVIGSEFVETTSLPQLFEDIDYMQLKSALDSNPA